ncbi:hypothetical protein, partial [Chamaesiphon sp.]|uniref:hypothetical protein n=1 Tax=Chamaesiphon sp. TaxID=2814140 RepID=UPI0035932AB3
MSKNFGIRFVPDPNRSKEVLLHHYYSNTREGIYAKLLANAMAIDLPLAMDESGECDRCEMEAAIDDSLATLQSKIDRLNRLSRRHGLDCHLTTRSLSTSVASILPLPSVSADSLLADDLQHTTTERSKPHSQLPQIANI